MWNICKAIAIRVGVQGDSVAISLKYLVIRGASLAYSFLPIQALRERKYLYNKIIKFGSAI